MPALAFINANIDKHARIFIYKHIYTSMYTRKHVHILATACILKSMKTCQASAYIHPSMYVRRHKHVNTPNQVHTPAPAPTHASASKSTI